MTSDGKLPGDPSSSGPTLPESDSRSEVQSPPEVDPGTAGVPPASAMDSHPISDSNTSVDEAVSTGLPWPKTWNGIYWFVFGTFIFYLAGLIALTEFFS